MAKALNKNDNKSKTTNSRQTKTKVNTKPVAPKEEVKKETKEDKVEPKQEVINLRPDITRESFGKEIWVNVEDLVVDEDTQRSSMETHIKKIMKNFDAKAFGRISVSKREDGKYYVTDGWHRTQVCKRLGLKEVPCIMIENKEKETKQAKKQDALQFLRINENSSSVSAIDKYKIGVSAEVEEWLRVKECVECNGLKVIR